MFVFTEQDIFWFQITVNNPECMEILQSDEHFSGEESNGLEGEAVIGLLREKRMEVSIGTVVNQETDVMRNFEVGVESREKRVVKHGENLDLHLYVGEFLGAEQIFIDDFEGEAGAGTISEVAKEDASEVSGAEVADEF